MPAVESAEGLVAGIVAFHPRPDELLGLVEALVSDVPVLVYRNSPLAEELECELKQRHGERIGFVGAGANLGLGTAYNVLARVVAAGGARQLVLFDQDSAPGPRLVRELAARMNALIRSGYRPAAVGPVPRSPDERQSKTPRIVMRPGMAASTAGTPVEFLISSGSLIDLSALSAIGGFREDFFIDCIDMEWGLRAWNAGYSSWLASGLEMRHRLGSGVIRIPLLGIRMVRQPAPRIQTYLRNQLAMLRLGHVGWRWKARAVPRLLAHSVAQVCVASDRAAMARAVVAAWRDGIGGHLGPPAERQRSTGREA